MEDTSSETTLLKVTSSLAVGFIWMNIYVPQVMETTITWEEQVEEAFFLCWAHGNPKIVLMF